MKKYGITLLVVIICVAMFVFVPLQTFALDVSAHAINAPSVWSQGIDGTGVRVVVMDSGIDNTHPALEGKVIAAVDFTNDNNTTDLYGHGTHCAGIIASTDSIYKGVAFGCELINVKIMNEYGDSTKEWYLDAIAWCINNKLEYGIKIISLSGGKPTVFPEGNFVSKYPCDGTCDYCRKAEEAIEAGIVFVAAAGNEGEYGARTCRCPGYSFNVITVGACDDYRTDGIGDDTLSGYSSRGPSKDSRPKPDVLAPGDEYFNSGEDKKGIWSCKSSNYKDYLYDEISPNGLWGRITGTSMAAPHVSGTVALMLEANPDLTQAQAKAILRQKARLNDNLEQLDINDRGYGIIDADQAVYVAQHPILMDPNLTFDDYLVESKEIGENKRLVSVNVGRTSYGINLHVKSYQFNPFKVYEIFGSIQTPYLWIDNDLYPLGAFQFLLSSGPRVSAKEEGYVTIKAVYKIGDVTAKFYYYVGVYKIQPWTLIYSDNSHSYKKLIYLDVDLQGSDHDYTTYENGTIIYRERKLTNTQINVKDTQQSIPWLKIKPYLGCPYTWILKYDGEVYSNPEDGKNNENVYNSNIVLYYEYPNTYVGPWIDIKYN